MKSQILIALTLLVCAPSLSADDQQLQDAPIVVPAIESWEPIDGTTQLCGKVYYNSLPDSMIPTAKLAVESLAEHGINLSRHISLFGTPQEEDFKDGTLVFRLDSSLKQEAYTLDIGRVITLSASDAQGFLWGTRTLEQMSRAGNALPRGVIHDAPKYKVRALMLDVARKYYSIEDLYQWVRICSYLKINEIHLHLNESVWGGSGTYRLESKKFPLISTPNEHYTFEEIKALIAYAKSMGIRIIPEIDTPGHASAFTKVRPELAHEEIGSQYLDIFNPQTYRFVEAILDEVAPLFEAEDFHIGTDEYRIGGMADKQTREKTGEQFRKYINHMANYVRFRHGKNVRIWSGYENMPGTTVPPRSVIIDMWETSDANTKSKEGYKFINSSHGRTYIVPGAPYYGVNNAYLYEKWTPRVFDRETLPDTAPGVLGGKLHIWNDMGETGYTHNEIARLSIPSLAAISNGLWGTRQFEKYDDFKAMTTPLWENIPGVTINKRFIKNEETSKADSVVWQLKNLTYFVQESTYPMNVTIDGKVRENLEYPWTASFVVSRAKTQPKSRTEPTQDVPEVLISSPLAGFYLDLERIGDKKENTLKRGVGIMRTQRKVAPSPTKAWDTAMHIFSYKMPIKQEVVLTFVGTERNTKLYVNGKLVDQTPIQMLCPLKTLGNDCQTVPASFQGKVRYAEILDQALTPKEVETFAKRFIKE